MPQPLHIDTLIVGAGLAGSLLAWQLMQAGKKIHILHNPSFTSASRVAAGLINPVTGQRLVLQEHIEDLLPTAHALYRQLGEHFQQQFFYAKAMLRSLQNSRLKQAWTKRQHDSNYHDYLSPVAQHSDIIQQHQTGYLDTNALLDALHHYFQEHGCMTCCELQNDDIHIQHNTIQYQHMTASSLIYCQGWREINGKFFSFLPFQPAKGEILHLSTKKKLPEAIINQDKWLLPLQHGSFKLGATYQSNMLNEQATEEGKQQLLAALNTMPIDSDGITLLEHQAGIRPNTLDKQPFLGMHPQHPNIGIFNGFGSKGSLLIPWYSICMCEHLIHHAALPKHADIQRFACV